MTCAASIRDPRLTNTSFRLVPTAVLAALLAAALTGCASFKEVRAFASLSANAASHESIARDYIGALDRRKQYQPSKFQGELEAQKTRREAQRASIDLLQQTIADYMLGLDALASGDIRTFDISLNNLSSRLNDATFLDSSQKDAVGALSTLLARAATSIYRQHEIKKLVHDSNQPLQDIIDATRNILKSGIVPDLQVEYALVKRYYDNFMLAPDNPREPVAMAIAEEAKAETLGRVDNRIRSAQSYDAVLERISAGHQYLYDHRDMIGNDDFGQQLKPYIDELRAAYRTLVDVSR
jgi:hypothetical protein